LFNQTSAEMLLLAMFRYILTTHTGRALNKMQASISSHSSALRAPLRRLLWGNILLISRRYVMWH